MVGRPLTLVRSYEEGLLNLSFREHGKHIFKDLKEALKTLKANGVIDEGTTIRRTPRQPGETHPLITISIPRPKGMSNRTDTQRFASWSDEVEKLVRAVTMHLRDIRQGGYRPNAPSLMARIERLRNA